LTQPGEHRETARVILRNVSGEFLLLLTHFDPEVGLPPRWLTPGGGIDAGESTKSAAVRELFEETGLRIDPVDLGDLVAEFSGRWEWSDGENFHTYTDFIYELTVDDFALDKSNWTPEEHRDVLEIKWWSLSELELTEELISPPGLIPFLVNR